MAKLESQLILSLIDRVTAPVRALTGTLDRLTAAQARNSARLDAMRGRMVEAGAVAYALARAVSAPIKSAMDLESAMADVAKVTNFDDAGLKSFEKDLRKLAVTEIPLAVTELTALAAAAAQAGVPETELLDFTRTTAKAAVAWEVTGDKAGESLAKLRSALGMSNAEVALYADAINHLSDNTASSAPDLIDFAQRVAAQGEFYGIAREQSLAFGAAMIGAGAQSEVAATSFRNMGRALTKGASSSKAARRGFQAIGLDAVKVAKSMQQDGVGTILDVMERLGKLPEHLQAAAMSDLFGDEARALAPLLGRMDILREALSHVADETAYAGSVNAEFARRAQTTEYAVQRFKSQLNELGITVGAALLPALNRLMESLGPLINRVAQFADANPKLTQAVVALTAGLVGLRVAAIAAQFGFLWMKGGLITAAIAGLRGLQGAARVASVALLPVTAAFRGLRTAMIGYAAAAAVGGHGAALTTMGGSLMGMLNPLRLVTAAFHGLKYALIGTGIGAALVGIAAAGTWIYNNWTGISTAFEAFKGAFMRAIEPVMPALQPAIDGFSWLWEKVSGLLGPIDELGGGWARAGIAVGKFVGEAIVAIVELPGKIIAVAGEMLTAGAALASSLWDGIKSRFETGLTWMQTQGEAFGTMLEGWRDSAAAALTGLPEKLQAIVPEMLEAGKALGKAIYDGVAALISELASYIKNSLTGALSSVSNYVSGLASRAANFVGLGGGGDSTPAVDGKFASGGPFKAGGAYLVGERGPEIIVPSHSGYVIPNHAIGGSGSTQAAPAAPQGRGDVTVNMGGFTIYQQPGESADRLADRLAAKVQDMLAGTFSDGAYA